MTFPMFFSNSNWGQRWLWILNKWKDQASEDKMTVLNFLIFFSASLEQLKGMSCSEDLETSTQQFYARFLQI